LSQDAPSQNCAKNDDVNDRNKPADRAVKEKTEGNQVEKDGAKGALLGLANVERSGGPRKGHGAGRLRVERHGRIHKTSIAERDEQWINAWRAVADESTPAPFQCKEHDSRPRRTSRLSPFFPCFSRFSLILTKCDGNVAASRQGC